jgi:hypothetical protein
MDKEQVVGIVITLAALALFFATLYVGCQTHRIDDTGHRDGGILSGQG